MERIKQPTYEEAKFVHQGGEKTKDTASFAHALGFQRLIDVRWQVQGRRQKATSFVLSSLCMHLDYQHQLAVCVALGF